jgi:hypothetical protein
MIFHLPYLVTVSEDGGVGAGKLRTAVTPIAAAAEVAFNIKYILVIHSV